MTDAGDQNAEAAVQEIVAATGGKCWEDPGAVEALRIAFAAGRGSLTAPARPMLVEDLYAGSYHTWPDSAWSGGDTACRLCGVHLGSFFDDEYGCRGPWRMRRLGIRA